jgi:hypothetical protein
LAASLSESRNKSNKKIREAELMHEPVSFGDGAEARRRIGNVFLGLTEVKRARRAPPDFELYFSRLLI